MTATTTPLRGKRKTKIGRVVSDKMDKTIVVSVERLSRHRIYKRVIRLTTKFKAHDERNEAQVGDTVRIEEARPLSATKRWRMTEIVARADAGAGETVVSEDGSAPGSDMRRSVEITFTCPVFEIGICCPGIMPLLPRSTLAWSNPFCNWIPQWSFPDNRCDLPGVPPGVPTPCQEFGPLQGLLSQARCL